MAARMSVFEFQISRSRQMGISSRRAGRLARFIRPHYISAYHADIVGK